MSDKINEKLGEISAVLTEISDGNLMRRLPEPEDPNTPLGAVTRGVNSVVEAWRASELKARTAKKDLQNKLATIETQAAAIRELSTPIMEIWEDTLLVPIVGSVDERRTTDILDAVLNQIAKQGADNVIIDMTGVHVVDTLTADCLLNVIKASSLLGARCVLTGLSPAIAQTLVTLGADLSQVKTLNTLKSGLQYCIEQLSEGGTMKANSEEADGR